MPEQPAQPFGLWKSPVTPRSLAGGLRLSGVAWDSDGATLVWLEGRSAQGVLVAATVTGKQVEAPRDLTTDLSVRARVGYGGGDFTVGRGSVFFAEAQSSRLYRQELAGGPARPITPAFGHAASPALAPDGRHLIFIHSYERTDLLAIVDATGQSWPQRLATGHDFYMQPCWHPSGAMIAYIAWDHPNMPWDGTLLYLAELRQEGNLPAIATSQMITGDRDTAIFQPAFSPDGRYLAFVSDTSGWGQLWLYELASGEMRRLTGEEAEYGEPAWTQGQATFTWAHDSSALYALRNQRGIRTPVRVPLDGSPTEPITGLTRYSWVDALAASPATDQLALIASSSRQPARLVLAGNSNAQVVKRTAAELVTEAALVEGRPVTWKTGATEVHGILYLPRGFEPGTQPCPPAVVAIHGGPTSQAPVSYNGRAQFFATRGYTYLEVNYRGSTGYGRPYMLELRNNWGVCDVEDAASAAGYLAEAGLADLARIVIMGGSAGGFTVLETLCRAPGVFRAGICLYGVSSMFGLAAETHKFEERYLDTMLGPLPEAGAIYRERSPLFHADLLKDPLIIFQGEIDQVVPRNQSDQIVDSLRRRGVPHEYHVYADEGHGWRKTETIEHFYNAIDSFLRRYVIFA